MADGVHLQYIQNIAMNEVKTFNVCEFVQYFILLSDLISVSYCFSLFHLVSLQLLSHFIHVPVILRYQRSHYTVTQIDKALLCVCFFVCVCSLVHSY